MNSSFNHEQLKADIADVREFLGGFLKSFGPKSVKVGEETLSFVEERKIRFRLMLVEMGISKIIRTVIFALVALVVFLPLMLYADGIMKAIIGFAFLSYGIWLFMDHLVVDKKPVSAVAGYLVSIHEARIAGQETFGSAVSDMLDAIVPNAAGAEAKK